MSDIRGERGISLREVPDHLPKRRGKKLHYSTVYRPFRTSWDEYRLNFVPPAGSDGLVDRMPINSFV